MLYAFLDTTALHKSYALSGSQWSVIESGIEQGALRVAISDVTVMELERQAMREVADANALLKTASSVAQRVNASFNGEPIDLPASLWRLKFGARLRQVGIDVIPHPNVPHAQLLGRDLAGMPPFKANGEGYRDTLIWMTFMSWLAQLRAQPSDVVIFVSGNTRQFAESNGRLAEALAKESSAHATVVFANGREAIVEQVRLLLKKPVAELASSQASTADIAENAAGYALISLTAPLENVDGLRMGDVRVEVDEAMPSLREVSIDWIDGENALVDANLIEALSGTTELWDVVIEAAVHLEAEFEAPELHELSDADIRHIDWENELVTAFLPVLMRFRYNVRVERQDQAGHAELREVSLRRLA
ncbi:PIN domain-containing protein [Microbacterium sp. E-13]|uniref:PIN domain-containing protein n=1 Tax=Microbacterium sp. E-13 TaxID=3404048 RepID=UPI003CF710FF